MEQFNQQPPQQFPPQFPQQTPPPSQTFQQVNLHKEKSNALMFAAVGLIAIFLPWLSVSVEGGQQAGTHNGLVDWGFLSLVGIAVVLIATLFVGNKLWAYDANTKKIILAAFAAMTVGAVISFFHINSTNNLQAQLQDGTVANLKVSAGFGLWTEVIAGVAGIASLTGVLKSAMASGNANQTGTAMNQPPQQNNMQVPPVYNQQTPPQYNQQVPQQFQQQPPQNPQSNQSSYPPPPPPTH